MQQTRSSATAVRVPTAHSVAPRPDLKPPKKHQPHLLKDNFTVGGIRYF
jgi:hypothetical protein